MLRRAAGRYDAGRWRVVTGKIEAGEAAWQAALRELREETGLQAERLLAVPYVNQFYEWEHDRINAIPVFLAVVDADAAIVLDGEHAEYAWLGARGRAAERLGVAGAARGAARGRAAAGGWRGVG